MVWVLTGIINIKSINYLLPNRNKCNLDLSDNNVNIANFVLDTLLEVSQTNFVCL